MASAMEETLNPIAEARRRAAAQVADLLATDPGPGGFGVRLVALAGAVARQVRDGFHRRLPCAAKFPQADPTWLPVAASDLADRLAADGLIRHDEDANTWVWSDDWFGAELALRDLERPGPDELREMVGALLRGGTSKTAEGALALLVDRWIAEGATDHAELKPFLESKMGVEAIASALALRAPFGPEESLGPALDAFTRFLDGVFGSPRELERPPARLREAWVLDRVQARLARLAEARPARRLLVRRILHQSLRVLEMEPRHEDALHNVARAHAVLGGLEDQPAAAFEEWGQAIAALEPFAASTPFGAEGKWARDFLSTCCRAILELPPEGDPARRRAVFAAAERALAAQARSGTAEEESLRLQLLFLDGMLDPDRDASDNGALLEGCRERVDRLVRIAPHDRRYREGRQAFLREYAEYLDPADPERAAAIRAEAHRLALADARELPATEKEAREGSPAPAEPATPGVAQAAADEQLLAEIRLTWRTAVEDPPRAVEAAQRALVVLCRSLAEEAIGCVPGHPTADHLASWLQGSGILPDRLVHAIQVIDLGGGWSGNRTGRHCHAAISRLARWYFGEHRRTELPPELAAGALAGPRLRAVEIGGVATGPAVEGASGESGPAGDAAPRSRARLGPRETEPSRRQHELARELGVPVRIEEPRTGMVLLLVPGGELWMGGDPTDSETTRNEQPRLRVRLRPFYCGAAPVLQEEWARLLAPNRSDFPGPRLPVTNLVWGQVQEFLELVNRGRKGPPLRLLSEAEWEHAARAGATTPYWWGWSYRAGWANCSEEGVGSGPQGTSEPGEYPPNPFGLLDIHGNVCEWCADFWFPTLEGYSPFGLPRARSEDDLHSLRGGSWRSLPDELRASARRCALPPIRFGDIGFRCAVSVG